MPTHGSLTKAGKVRWEWIKAHGPVKRKKGSPPPRIRNRRRYERQAFPKAWRTKRAMKEEVNRV